MINKKCNYYNRVWKGRDPVQNIIRRISGVISVTGYILLLYQIWHLCQYGGIRSHLLMLAAAAALFAAGGITWLVTGLFMHFGEKKAPVQKKSYVWLWLGIAVMAAATVYFGGRIIYSGLPYNGALSWKIDELRNKRKVELKHNNFFESGAEGVLSDLDEALGLPDELYVTDQFQMTFKSDGTIRSIYTFLYGKDAEGNTRTYLVDYDASGGTKMTVWKDGYSGGDYDADMKLTPMLRILEKASCEEQVADWEKMRGGDTYEILYMGRRSFPTEAGLVCLPGDADGDGAEDGDFVPGMLNAGGKVLGYEVSLHIPDAEEITPVRYMMEPEYISPEQISSGHDQQQTEEAKEEDLWTTDNTNGSMRYFLDDQHGWKLSVVDAAAGSRFYDLSRTEDGGATWETVNGNPFAGNIGVAEGLQFFDEDVGFAGLSGASQSHSQIFMTTDGGSTFTEIILPMDQVAELPEHAEEYGHTLEDYAYLCMPVKDGDAFTIDVLTAAGENEGIRFRSEDGGVTWKYDGVFQK